MSAVQTKNGSPKSCAICPYVTAMDIVSWKNTTTTACVLASVNLAFVVFWGFDFSIIRLIASLGLIAMGLGFVASMIVDRKESRVELVTKAQLEHHLTPLYDILNRIALQAYNLFYWENQASSAKACVCLAVLAYISTWITLPLLAFVGINVLFFTQQLHDTYEKYVSPQVEKVCGVAQKNINNISKLSKHKTQ